MRHAQSVEMTSKDGVESMLSLVGESRGDVKYARKGHGKSGREREEAKETK